MEYSIEQLIREAGDLPPLPQAAQKALALVRDPETNAGELADVICMDQVLTTLLLRWANSAIYGMQNRVGSISQSVIVLGMDTVHNIILASSVAAFLDRPLPGYDLRRGELWRHALGVAVGAKMIAKRKGGSPDEAYHAGLLCDVGKLVIDRLLRASGIPAGDLRRYNFIDIERVQFGVDHATLGGEMANRWRLPESLRAAIAYHHAPQAAGEHLKIAATVHIADSVMMMLGVGVGCDGLQYTLDDRSISLLGVTERDISDVYEEVLRQIQLAEAFIGLSGGNIRQMYGSSRYAI